MRPLYEKKSHIKSRLKYFGQAPLLFSEAMECDCQTFEQ